MYTYHIFIFNGKNRLSHRNVHFREKYADCREGWEWNQGSDSYISQGQNSKFAKDSLVGHQLI